MVRSHGRLRLRMGIHSGPVSRLSDINNQNNVAGSGINIAQRVMDFGDAGHILISSAAADVLREFETWANCLHDLGEFEAKHGVRIHLYNLHMNEVGNPVPPARASSGGDAKAPTIEVRLGPSDAQPRRESAGGAVPLDSPYYIERTTDRLFRDAIAGQDSIVLVKGGRQVGKTSLLARGLQQARSRGAKAVFIDFQALASAHLVSTDALYRALADAIADQLDLDVLPEEVWNEKRAANTNLERYLRREVLGTFDGPLVWGLDEVDRLFTVPFGSEVFGLFRSWHNRRSLDPEGPWSRLTLAIAYATEAHLFITDLNQSPFNVGTRLALADFDLTQTGELNRRYSSPLTPQEVTQLYGLVNGQPYLTRRGLDELAAGNVTIETLQAQATRDEGVYGDHLRRILVSLTQDAELTSAARNLLRGTSPPSDVFYRLRGAGLLTGEAASEAQFRCRLYRDYLARHLT